MAVAEPVKLLACLLFADREGLDGARAKLEEVWGRVDHEGVDHDFDLTDYYEAEMGPGLSRRLLSFADLVSPERLVRAKRVATEIEDHHRGARGRRVNIDMGYLDTYKLVLASSKPGAPKIYLGDGVHADPVARYSKGAFHYEEWTFADFRDGRYEKDLLRVRERYKEALR